VIRVAVIAVALAVAAPALAAPPASHDAAARVAQLQAALGAVHAASPAALQKASDYLRALHRGGCSSGVARLQVECLMTAARRFCKRGEAELHGCLVVLDVLASNVLAEDRWIAPERRYEIMRAQRDWRRAVAAELRRIQGALAVDFHLREGDAADDAALARKIDHFCLTTSDETNLAWQTCAATLVWFVEREQP
jgi:hypothetical protein